MRSYSTRRGYTRKRYTTRPKYRINKLRLITILSLILIIVVVVFIIKKVNNVYPPYKIQDFDSSNLNLYFTAAEREGTDWRYIAAVDKAEEFETADEQRVNELALYFNDVTDIDAFKARLMTYNKEKAFVNRALTEYNRLIKIEKVLKDKVFPLRDTGIYSYTDDFGNARSYGGKRKHEGNDIMCDEGTVLVAICDGEVEKKGWLELGGWRIGIRGSDGIYYYYAHLSRYNDNLHVGDKVKKGELIGYVGSTGYGQEGTNGKFAPHLHFGMYEGKEMNAVNPYPFLRAWENVKH